MPLKLIHKMKLVTEAATLEVTVAKEGGPLNSAVEVASTGSDDASFKDAALTPGPATKALDSKNSYGLLWTIAFARKGAATLTAKVTTASGQTQSVKTRKVSGAAGDVVSRMIFIP